MEITTEPREKGNAGELVLPKVAIDIINALPKFESNPYVFAGRSCTHFSDYSNAKRRFDAEIEDVEPWTIHDLRRTARSLMSRASVRSDIAVSE